MSDIPKDSPAEKIARDRLIGLAASLGITDAATMKMADVWAILAEYDAREFEENSGFKP